MRIDWERLLTKHRVEYITQGPNVKRGEVNIRCPFCGNADPSYHMGISPDTSYWACWRNAEHRGKSPVRLLMRLLHVDYGVARELAGLGDDYVDPDGFSAFMNKLRNPEVSQAAPDALELPEDSVLITDKVRTRRHWNYLYSAERCFPAGDIDAVCRAFNLRASLQYRWRDRIIMPYYEENKLVTWTARAISRSDIRYKDLSIDESIVPVKQTLYNADAMNHSLAGGLLLVEGPFDVVKADFYGRRLGIRAVGLSTATISDQQVYRLTQWQGNFPWIGICLDQSSELSLLASRKMVATLAHLKTPVRAVTLPDHWQSKDFGGATREEVTGFLRSLKDQT